MKFNQVVPMMSVEDVTKAVHFYRLTFGFEVINEQYEQDELVWCIVRAGHALLMLQRESRGKDLKTIAEGSDTVFYFYIEDVCELHSKLSSKGYKISPLRKTEYKMTEFEMKDPEGHRLWFGEATHRVSAAQKKQKTKKPPVRTKVAPA